MWGVNKNNNNVGAFAWSDERWAGVAWNLSFANDRSRILERIPVMNVGGRLRNFIRDKVSNIVGWKIANNAMKRAIETITESIMQEIARIDFNTRSVVEAKRVNKFAAFAERRRK